MERINKLSQVNRIMLNTFGESYISRKKSNVYIQLDDYINSVSFMESYEYINKINLLHNRRHLMNKISKGESSEVTNTSAKPGVFKRVLDALRAIIKKIIEFFRKIFKKNKDVEQKMDNLEQNFEEIKKEVEKEEKENTKQDTTQDTTQDTSQDTTSHPKNPEDNLSERYWNSKDVIKVFPMSIEDFFKYKTKLDVLSIKLFNIIRGEKNKNTLRLSVMFEVARGRNLDSFKQRVYESNKIVEEIEQFIKNVKPQPTKNQEMSRLEYIKYVDKIFIERRKYFRSLKNDPIFREFRYTHSNSAMSETPALLVFETINKALQELSSMQSDNQQIIELRNEMIPMLNNMYKASKHIMKIYKIFAKNYLDVALNLIARFEKRKRKRRNQ